MVSALGQCAGALATFAAVLIALRKPKPEAIFVVGERTIIGGYDDGMNLLMFELANSGERAFQVLNIGWVSGWLKWGPACLRRKSAIQMLGGTTLGEKVPFEVLPGARKSAYCLLENVLEHAQKRVEDPVFTRDWPDGKRRKTRVRAFAYTADGHSFRVWPEKDFLQKIVAAEMHAVLSLER